jgi:hypothetical protein
MFLISKFVLSTLALFIQISAISSKWVIWDEVISEDRIQTRIKNFNEWYQNFNPQSSKVEARLTEDPEFMRIGLYAKEDLKTDDSFLKINKSKMISYKHIYDTPLGGVIKKLEAVHGFDDYVNVLFYLLHEMNNKNSQWKPYLDLLPRQPTSLAFKYWERKSWIEEELLNTPFLSKLFYKY